MSTLNHAPDAAGILKVDIIVEQSKSNCRLLNNDTYQDWMDAKRVTDWFVVNLLAAMNDSLC